MVAGAVQAWRATPWPGGRGRYFFKRALRALVGAGRRASHTDVGWLVVGPGQDVLEEHLFFHGTHWETSVAAYLQGADLEGCLAVDVGAHAGYFTLLLASKVGTNGRVVAIEARPDQAERIEQALVINGVTNVQVHAALVGDCDGEITLFDDEDGGRSSISPGRSAFSSRRVMARQRLTSILDLQQYRRVAMKVDIEGSELNALLGMGQMLSSDLVDPLLIEIHPLQLAELGQSQAELLELLRDKGYRLRQLGRSGPVEIPASAPPSSAWHLLATASE